jgi:hypothetical protein
MLRSALPKLPSRFTPLGTRDVTGELENIAASAISDVTFILS